MIMIISSLGGGGRGVLHYISYIGMCQPIALEIVVTRKNARERRRHACLPRARPFSLPPATSKPLLYAGYAYRVGFLGLFGLKTGIHFAYFGLESGMVFEGTTGVYERIYRFTPNE